MSVPFLSLSDSIERGFDTFFEWLPSLIGALVILLIGFIVAKIVGGLVARILGGAGLDRTLLSGNGGEWVRKVTTSPSNLLGRIAFWVIFLGGVSLAATALGIEALSAFVASVYTYIPNIIAAILIFLVAGAIAAGVSTLAARFFGDTPTGRVVSTAAPILVMTIATFMILDQLKIAQNIVVITYALILGSVALGAALAFGLGGREVAADMLRGAYDKGQRASDQARRDIELGRRRAAAGTTSTETVASYGDGSTRATAK